MKIRSAPLDDVHGELRLVLENDGGLVARLVLWACSRGYRGLRAVELRILKRRWRSGVDR